MVISVGKFAVFHIFKCRPGSPEKPHDWWTKMLVLLKVGKRRKIREQRKKGKTKHQSAMSPLCCLSLFG